MKGFLYYNAVAEAIFKVIETEFIYLKQFKSLDHLTLKLSDYINWFNTFRINRTLVYKRPLDFRAQAISILYSLVTFEKLSRIITIGRGVYLWVIVN